MVFAARGKHVCVAVPSSQIGSKKPSPTLRSLSLKSSYIWWIAVSSRKSNLVHFSLGDMQVGSNSQGAKQLHAVSGVTLRRD